MLFTEDWETAGSDGSQIRVFLEHRSLVRSLGNVFLLTGSLWKAGDGSSRIPLDNLPCDPVDAEC